MMKANTKRRELHTMLQSRELRNVTYTNVRNMIHAKGPEDENHIIDNNNTFHILREGKTCPEDQLVARLKTCTKQKDLISGVRIYEDLMSRGLIHNNVFINNTLITMYAKHGILDKSRELFDGLSVRTIVSWNALITGHLHNGNTGKAFHCFQQLQVEGFLPNRITVMSSLKACSIKGCLEKGQQVHAQILKDGLLDKDVVVGNGLVDMYAKCGEVLKAQGVFDELPFWDVVSWNSLISGYTRLGHLEHAFKYFKRMQVTCLSPDAITYVSVLKICSVLGALDRGKHVHVVTLINGLVEKDVVAGNALVDMYSKCGEFRKALRVFDEIPARNVVSWNALISGYVQQGNGDKALNCFEQMMLGGVSPNIVTFICALKACAIIGEAIKGEEIHSLLIKEELLQNNNVLACSLLDMYAKCGLLWKAQEVFEMITVWDVISWNALIAGYSQHGYGQEALNCFEQMQLAGVVPDEVTCVSVLQACGIVLAADEGEKLHVQILKKGLLENNDIVGNALVDMYAKCGLLVEAQCIFDNLPTQEVISYNALMAGYVQCGRGKEALNCFERMRCGHLSPDDISFVIILKACSIIGASGKGQFVHAEIVKIGLMEIDLAVGTTLVDMYAKCGELTTAQHIFNGLPYHNVVSWSALISGYTQHGDGEEALNCFEQMQVKGLSPDDITFVCILKACGSIGTGFKGLKIHDEITRQGLIDKNSAMGNALVDMYAKCGMHTESYDVFNELPDHDAVSWNVITAGYAQIGNDDFVFFLFNKMIEEGSVPDEVTFTNLLSACSHAGHVDDAYMVLETMLTNFSIVPALDHLTCMVDMFGRSDCVDEALAVIREMPFKPSLTIWNTLLGACQKWVNVDLGKFAFENALQMDEMDASRYVSLRNIYAAAGIFDHVNETEAILVGEQAWSRDFEVRNSFLCDQGY